jgi:microcompartment protein CcmL/EutN
MGDEALCLVELDAVATGLRCLDAALKKAPIEVFEANLIEPGRFLLLFGGGVAEVEESHREVREVGAGAVLVDIRLPFVHPQLMAGLFGRTTLGSADELDTLGVVEGRSVAPILEACDRSLKDADVRLAGIRTQGGLGGRAYYLVCGVQHDVEAAIEAGEAILNSHGALHRVERIARPHDELVRWLLRPAPFLPARGA